MPKYQIEVSVSATATLEIEEQNKKKAIQTAHLSYIPRDLLEDVEISFIENVKLIEGEEKPKITNAMRESAGQLVLQV